MPKCNKCGYSWNESSRCPECHSAVSHGEIVVERRVIGSDGKVTIEGPEQSKRVHLTGPHVHCPFCSDRGFDLAGLKKHLTAGYCDRFNTVPNLPTHNPLI